MFAFVLGGLVVLGCVAYFLRKTFVKDAEAAVTAEVKAVETKAETAVTSEVKTVEANVAAAVKVAEDQATAVVEEVKKAA